MLVKIRAGNHNMLARIANREDPEQTASSEAVWSGSALFVSLLDRQLVFKILEHLLYHCILSLQEVYGLSCNFRQES